MRYKFTHLLIAFAMMSILTFGLAAQETPEPILLDEYDRLPCDDLLGRLDMFFGELSRDPSSVGLVVISAQKENKWRAVFHQHLIEAHAGSRKFISNPIKYVRNTSSNAFTTQLWRIPRGAAEPTITDVDVTFELPADIKPFILGEKYPYGDGICPEVDNDESIFAEFLKGNPNSRGNIVVRERNLELARRESERIRRVFPKRYRIPSSRLRFFPRKVSIPRNNLEPIVEYWYLP